MKYYDSTFIASNFAKIIVNMHKDIMLNVDFVIPVPMHKWKRLFRLYNQSQILASALAQEAKIKMLPDVLMKIKHTKSQTGLSKKQRQENLKGSIAVVKKEVIKGKKVILVDDVMTTGSTVDLCAATLKKAGAKEVVVVCVARTLI